MALRSMSANPTIVKGCKSLSKMSKKGKTIFLKKIQSSNQKLSKKIKSKLAAIEELQMKTQETEAKYSDVPNLYDEEVINIKNPRKFIKDTEKSRMELWNNHKNYTGDFKALLLFAKKVVASTETDLQCCLSVIEYIHELTLDFDQMLINIQNVINSILKESTDIVENPDRPDQNNDADAEEDDESEPEEIIPSNKKTEMHCKDIKVVEKRVSFQNRGGFSLQLLGNHHKKI